MEKLDASPIVMYLCENKLSAKTHQMDQHRECTKKAQIMEYAKSVIVDP